jgi:FKBP-type peptidyl-prolyl cis-trans isomerase
MKSAVTVLALSLLLASTALAAEPKSNQQLLDEAKAAKGAMCTLSGAIVVPIAKGTGAYPTAASTVKVHYTGTLTNGRVFDSSVKRGVPAEFPLNRVIPCWTEGVQKIAVGGKAKLVCPPETAYGKRGAPGAVPPDSLLTFEVELLSIVR